jgi:hypothetical protein
MSTVFPTEAKRSGGTSPASPRNPARATQPGRGGSLWPPSHASRMPRSRNRPTKSTVVAAPVAANRAQRDNGRTPQPSFEPETRSWATQWRPLAAGGHGSRHYDNDQTLPASQRERGGYGVRRPHTQRQVTGPQTGPREGDCRTQTHSHPNRSRGSSIGTGYQPSSPAPHGETAHGTHHPNPRCPILPIGRGNPLWLPSWSNECNGPAHHR